MSMKDDNNRTIITSDYLSKLKDRKKRKTCAFSPRRPAERTNRGAPRRSRAVLSHSAARCTYTLDGAVSPSLTTGQRYSQPYRSYKPV